MKNNNVATPNNDYANQSENHYTDMHTIVPAVVLSTGYAPDGEYYAEVVAFNTETNDQHHAFVRFSDERELANSYKELYDSAPRELSEAKAAQDAKTLMKQARRKGGNNRDLFGMFANKAKQAQESGQFKDQDIETIVNDNSKNLVLMLKGISILGEADAADLAGPNADVGKNDKVLMLAADRISLSGLMKDHAYFKNDNLSDEYSPVADTYSEVEQAMVNIDFDAESQEATAYKVLSSASTISLDRMSKHPQPFLDMVSENANPTSNRLPSSPRKGYMQMDVNYGGNSHRLTFPSNHFTGGEHFNKSPEEYLELSEEWQHRGEKEAVSRFLAGQDPYSNSKNPDRDVLAKSDVLRIALRYASDYNFAKDFSEKIKSGDRNAFKGVTKFDYLSVPKDRLTAQQQMVVEFTDSVVNDPKNTFLGIANHEKVNLSVESKAAMSEFVKTSIVRATEGTENNALGQTSAALQGRSNSSLNIARANLYDHGKVNMIVIPATLVTDVAAGEGNTIESNQSEDKEFVIWGGLTTQVYPSLSNAPNPVMDNGRTHTETRSYYSHTPPPPSLIQRVTKDIDFDLESNRPLNALMGQSLPDNFMPSIDGNKFNNSFTYQLDTKPKGERLGFARVANNTITTRDLNKPNNLELSAGQLNRLASVLSRSEMFNPIAQANPDNSAIAARRFSEFNATIKELVGPFSKDNTTISNLRTALNSPKGAQLSEGHQKIRDMLLTDKLVDVSNASDNDDRKQSLANFKDLASLTIRPSDKMDSAIRADINGEQIKVETKDLSTHKQNRVNEAINQARNELTDPKNNVSADDLVKKAMEATHPRPVEQTMSPTPRF